MKQGPQHKTLWLLTGYVFFFLVVLFQTKDVTTAMAEGRFEDAIKLRGT